MTVETSIDISDMRKMRPYAKVDSMGLYPQWVRASVCDMSDADRRKRLARMYRKYSGANGEITTVYPMSIRKVDSCQNISIDALNCLPLSDSSCEEFFCSVSDKYPVNMLECGILCDFYDDDNNLLARNLEVWGIRFDCQAVIFKLTDGSNADAMKNLIQANHAGCFVRVYYGGDN